MEYVKQWLNRAWKIEEEIQTLQREYADVKDRAMFIAGSIDSVKVQTSKTNTTEAAILKCIEYSEKIKYRIVKQYEIKLEIENVISKVNDSIHRTLLRKRYLQYKTWEEIGEELNYTTRNVLYMHGRALQVVKECLH